MADAGIVNRNGHSDSDAFDHLVAASPIEMRYLARAVRDLIFDVTLGFNYGDELADPDGLLGSSGPPGIGQAVDAQHGADRGRRNPRQGRGLLLTAATLVDAATSASSARHCSAKVLWQ